MLKYTDFKLKDLLGRQVLYCLILSNGQRMKAIRSITKATKFWFKIESCDIRFNYNGIQLFKPNQVLPRIAGVAFLITEAEEKQLRKKWGAKKKHNEKIKKTEQQLTTLKQQSR